MYKHISTTLTDFLNENSKNINYYTTSTPITIDEFIELEVNERENYDIIDVNEWIDKYNINQNTKLLWVSTKPYIAARYEMIASDWDNAKEIYEENPNDYNIEIINSDTGYLIPESNDGDDGFLFVLI